MNLALEATSAEILDGNGRVLMQTCRSHGTGCHNSITSKSTVAGKDPRTEVGPQSVSKFSWDTVNAASTQNQDNDIVQQEIGEHWNGSSTAETLGSVIWNLLSPYRSIALKGCQSAKMYARTSEIGEKERFLLFGGALAVLQAMQHHWNCPVIQAYGAMSLDTLACNQRISDAIEGIGGAEVILQATKTHPRHYDVQGNSLVALNKICLGSNKGTRHLIELEVHHQVLRLVTGVSVYRYWGQNEQFLKHHPEAACCVARIVARSASLSTSLRRRLRNRGVSKVAKLLELRPNDQKLRKAIFQLMRTVCRTDDH